MFKETHLPDSVIACDIFYSISDNRDPELHSSFADLERQIFTEQINQKGKASWFI